MNFVKDYFEKEGTEHGLCPKPIWRWTDPAYAFYYGNIKLVNVKNNWNLKIIRVEFICGEITNFGK